MKYLIILSLLLTSCSDKYYDSSYKGEKSYKSFYLVDTITINHPVIFRLKGGRFLTSTERLKEIKQDKHFLERPDVFIVGLDLFYDLPIDNYKGINYKYDGGCSMMPKNDRNDEIETTYFSEDSVRFILGLINVNYYNTRYNSTHGFYEIKANSPKNSYYRIVYPLCLLTLCSVG